MAAKFTDNEIRVKVADLRQDELAYIAGIFDGEGCLKLNVKKSGEATIRVEVTNTCESLIQYLHNRVGLGSVYVKPATSRWRQTFWWIVCSREAVAVLRQVRPWLRVKAAQADVIITYAEEERARIAATGRHLTQDIRDKRRDVSAKLSLLKRIA